LVRAGSLDNEKKVADNLKYQVENRTIAACSRSVKAERRQGCVGVASDAADWSAGG